MPSKPFTISLNPRANYVTQSTTWERLATVGKPLTDKRCLELLREQAASRGRILARDVNKTRIDHDSMKRRRVRKLSVDEMVKVLTMD